MRHLTPRAGPSGPQAKQTCGGDDQRGRTRVAGAAGPAATGASRSRRRDRGAGHGPRLRPYPGTAAEEA